MALKPEEIIHFLKTSIDPLPDNGSGNSYRASVYLTDGTFLPCVLFQNREAMVNLAIRRFREEQGGKGLFRRSSGSGYERIVASFVTNRNMLNDFEIDRIEKSRFAFPVEILQQIKGETTMGWTGFAAKMKDGKHVGFGTRFSFEFFQLPDEYSVDDIEEIVSHSYVLKGGELRAHKVPFFEHPEDYKEAVIYRERSYFVCFLDHL